MFLQLLSGANRINAADTSNIMLTGYSVDKTNIYEGDSFNLTLNFDYSAGVTDLYVTVDSGAFSKKNSGSRIKVDNGQKSVTAPFAYDGGSNKLQVSFKYTAPDGSSGTQSDYVTIVEAKQKDTSTPVPVDTSKNAPKLVIGNNSSMPSGEAGSQVTYTLPVKNVSAYAAKSIVVSPVLDDSSPIDSDTMNISQTIDSLGLNETKQVKFTFNISSSAAAKNYPIKFNIQCYNYTNDYFSSTETGYLKVKAGSNLPKLVLKTVSTNPSPVHAGENFKLNITLENDGAGAAKNVTLILNGLKNEEATIIGSTNKKTIQSISGNSTSTVTFDLAASKKIPAGANSLTLKLAYADSTNATFSDEIQFFYNVQESNSISNIELRDITSPGNVLKPGDNALVSFNVVNTGATDVENVKVSVASDKEIIPRTQNTVIIPSLKKGGNKNVQFQLFVSDDAVTKNYPVSITVDYDTDVAGVKSKQTVMQYVGFYVENKSGKSVPRLIINKYSISPETLKAGQQFALSLSIMNTSKSATINNIKVTLTSDDGTFSAVNSNSFYIDSISPKASVTKKVTFSSKPDAAAKQYNITVNYEYEDEKGTALTSKDTVGLSIQQAPKFVIGELNVPAEAFVGSPIPINLSFYNMGKSTLYNLMVKLEGKFKVEGASYFVGNFDPGKTDTFDGTITPEATGKLTGNVVFTYEDTDGKSHEIKKEISLNVSQMPAENQNMEQAPPVKAQKKIPLWAYIAGGAVLLIIVVVVILVVRKKIKARKEFMLDEEI
jgi:hypothetical protein